MMALSYNQKSPEANSWCTNKTILVTHVVQLVCAEAVMFISDRQYNQFANGCLVTLTYEHIYI